MSDKNIIVSNIQEFYKIMCAHEDIIFKDYNMAVIKDYLDAAYNGCACRKKQNEDKALELFKVLNQKIDINVLNELKNILNAKELLFFHDNQHLFTI